MKNNQRGLLVITIFVILTMLISACTQSLSSIPEATPTLIPTGLFVSPFPSVENPMAMIEEFAKQTAAAQTMIAGGGTPGTPQAITTGTVLSTQTGSETPVPAIGTPGTPTNVISTPTNAVSAAATSVPPGVKPTSYTLQEGEHPYCIARRFNVDPDDLLALSGLTSAQANSLSSGTVLKIPQSGAFPGDRSLTSHPATYTVTSGDETLYSVACKYGDIDPNTIASANGISVSANLTAGQTLQIP